MLHHMTQRGRTDFGSQTPNRNLQLLIYDSPGGSINQRFHILPNSFGPCLQVKAGERTIIIPPAIFTHNKQESAAVEGPPAMARPCS